MSGTAHGVVLCEITRYKDYECEPLYDANGIAKANYRDILKKAVPTACAGNQAQTKAVARAAPGKLAWMEASGGHIASYIAKAAQFTGSKSDVQGLTLHIADSLEGDRTRSDPTIQKAAELFINGKTANVKEKAYMVPLDDDPHKRQGQLLEEFKKTAIEMAERKAEHERDMQRREDLLKRGREELEAEKTEHATKTARFGTFIAQTQAALQPFNPDN
jgi:hypothetical protein